MKLEITESPREEDDNFIIYKTRQYNLQFVENDFKPNFNLDRQRLKLTAPHVILLAGCRA